MVSRTSRKKNKGKERKAKKEETERVRKRLAWWGFAGEKKTERTYIRCNHGLGDIPMSDNQGLIPNDSDHPILNFLDDFLGNVQVNFPPENLFIASRPHTTILKNSAYREIIVNAMIKMGTNMMLLTNGDSISLSVLSLAKSICVLEHYVDSMNAALSNREVQTKLRDLHTGSRRDALKFYSKRVSCSCLKSMHQEARRTEPKMGRCHHCKKEKERVALSVCSRCMITQYCSKECHVAHWSEHKVDCDKLAANLLFDN